MHTSSTGVAVSAYYPMDKSTYQEQIKDKKNNTLWMRYGKDQVLGLTKATSNIGAKSHPPPCIFNYLKSIRMDTVQDGPLAADFSNQETSSILAPV
jgi:hypothetical protein